MPDGDLARHTLTPEKPRQSRAAKPAPAPRHVPLYVPGYSIETLGHQLALAAHNQHLLDELARKVSKRPASFCDDQLSAKRVSQNNIAKAEKAFDDHFYALRDLILRSRPITVADVVAQLIALDLHLEQIVHAGMEGDEKAKAEAVSRRVLCGAVRCLAEIHGLKIAELGRWTAADDLWPALDLSQVDPDLGAAAPSIDGSVAEWER